MLHFPRVMTLLACREWPISNIVAELLRTAAQVPHATPSTLPVPEKQPSALIESCERNPDVATAIALFVQSEDGDVVVGVQSAHWWREHSIGNKGNQQETGNVNNEYHQQPEHHEGKTRGAGEKSRKRFDYEPSRDNEGKESGTSIISLRDADF